MIPERERERVRSGERGGGRRGDIIYIYGGNKEEIENKNAAFVTGARNQKYCCSLNSMSYKKMIN